jgi:hypothetical protein
MPEYTELRRGSAPRRQEVTGCFRRLYNDELNGFYLSWTIISTMKPRIMRWAKNVTHKGDRKEEEHGRNLEVWTQKL